MPRTNNSSGAWKGPVAKRLMALTNNLCSISEQKGTDRDAQRRALAAINICRKLGFAGPCQVFLQERAIRSRAFRCPSDSERDMLSRLPTEIYIRIIKCVIDDRYEKSPEEMKVRAHTLQSLASTCRIFQILCEEYLYRNLRSTRLSTKIGPQWLLCFALMVEPRRAKAIRSITCDIWPRYYQYQAWRETLMLCTNLTHLELTWRGLASQSFVEEMGEILAACTKVTAFNLETCFYFDSGRPQPQIPKSSQHYAKFARHLCHLQVTGSFVTIREILRYDYRNLRSFTVAMEYSEGDGSFFQVLSRYAPNLEKLNINDLDMDSVQDLETGCKAWGNSLRSLYINDLLVEDLHDGILSRLLPHLTALEELDLGPQSRFTLSDIQAIAQQDAPRLKAFKWLVDETMFKYDTQANSENFSKAIIDIFIAHSATLNTFIIDEEFDLWSLGWIFSNISIRQRILRILGYSCMTYLPKKRLKVFWPHVQSLDSRKQG
ncbi:hypothetical protein FGADI_7333 [Fusarium gaditjirri]|uniref:Uncharacterized protein n=1 Tax=Fusarium gaditjirri TaxID=282569 RepID=A0A8H4WUS4_9HYPO|nr:hypothetical protein FGADI_7333 [Fusarium gaditjirri]